MRPNIHSRIESDAGPWRRYSCACGRCDAEHVVPGFGRRHVLHATCWCHPHVEITEGSDLVTHNVAQ